jgi:hypothetical protein
MPLEHDQTKFDAILQHAKKVGAIIAMDSNPRSKSWHHKITNNRGKDLEGYIVNKQLHIMNEPSRNTTFSNRIGRSNLHLILITNNLLSGISDWKINEEERNLDQSLLN